MCRVLKLNRSGFYSWLKKPISDRTREDSRLLKLIKQFYIASGATYGSPWIHQDLKEAGEVCSVHRVAKIMRQHNLKAKLAISVATSKAVNCLELLIIYLRDSLIQ